MLKKVDAEEYEATLFNIMMRDDAAQEVASPQVRRYRYSCSLIANLGTIRLT
jgi:hypothetical protein